MENKNTSAPNFKHQDNQPKRRISTSEIKTELRQEFRDRLRINRETQQDKSRQLSQYDIVLLEHEQIKNRLVLAPYISDIDTDLRVLDEIAQELLEMEETALEEFYTKEYEDVEAVLENCHVLCKICNNFLEQTEENRNRYICKECSVKYFQDEMN